MATVTIPVLDSNGFKLKTLIVENPILVRELDSNGNTLNEITTFTLVENHSYIDLNLHKDTKNVEVTFLKHKNSYCNWESEDFSKIDTSRVYCEKVNESFTVESIDTDIQYEYYYLLLPRADFLSHISYKLRRLIGNSFTAYNAIRAIEYKYSEDQTFGICWHNRHQGTQLLYINRGKLYQEYPITYNITSDVRPIRIYYYKLPGLVDVIESPVFGTVSGTTISIPIDVSYFQLFFIVSGVYDAYARWRPSTPRLTTFEDYYMEFECCYRARVYRNSKYLYTAWWSRGLLQLGYMLLNDGRLFRWYYLIDGNMYDSYLYEIWASPYKVLTDINSGNYQDINKLPLDQIHPLFYHVFYLERRPKKFILDIKFDYVNYTHIYPFQYNPNCYIKWNKTIDSTCKLYCYPNIQVIDLNDELKQLISNQTLGHKILDSNYNEVGCIYPIADEYALNENTYHVFLNHDNQINFTITVDSNTSHNLIIDSNGAVYLDNLPVNDANNLDLTRTFAIKYENTTITLYQNDVTTITLSKTIKQVTLNSKGLLLGTTFDTLPENVVNQTINDIETEHYVPYNFKLLYFGNLVDSSNVKGIYKFKLGHKIEYVLISNVDVYRLPYSIGGSSKVTAIYTRHGCKNNSVLGRSIASDQYSIKTYLS